MQDPPANLRDEDLRSALARGWAITVRSMTYVPKGFGSHHWLVEADDGRRRFATVDDLDTKPWLGSDRQAAFDGLKAAYRTAWNLQNSAGLRFVVSPEPDGARSLVVRLTDRYSLAVSAFVDGLSGRWGEPISNRERWDYLRYLAQMHRCAPPAAGHPPSAHIEIPGRSQLEASLTELDRPWSGGPLSEAARRTLAVRAGDLRHLLGAFDDLASAVVAARPEVVITHGEPHPGNFMQSRDGTFLVDWDTVACACPERDLWMFEVDSANAWSDYTDVTGRPVDARAIALYRLAWRLKDIAAFVTVLRAPHRATPDTRKAARSLELSLAGPEAPWRIG